MTINILNQWWQQYREVSYCAELNNELLMLLHGQSTIAQRLINFEKIKHPGQSQSWYLDKVIYDLRRSLL